MRVFSVDNNGRLSLKTTHDYWHQIHGQLYLTGTQCLRFSDMDNQRHADCKNCKRQDVGPKHFCHDRLLFHGVFGITEVNQVSYITDAIRSYDEHFLLVINKLKLVFLYICK